MAIITVEDSLRKKKRELKDALGDNILRYIAELVTNADDSYRRLESNNILFDNNSIYIELLKDKKSNDLEKENYLIRVTDNAEGMSYETLNKVFGTYGGDNAGGVNLHARGIFGQGASDVLRSAAKEKRQAQIETIRDGQISKLRYNMDENLNPSINVESINLVGNQLSQYRDKLGIPDNGTRITFGIPSGVKFKKKIRSNLRNLIEKYPTFRYLLAQTNRAVYFICNGKKVLLSSKEYEMPEIFLLDKSFDLQFENKIYSCCLKLYKNVNKSVDETHIIVRDENYTVYDNTMFDFQNALAAQDISGELIIVGLYDLCYQHLNAEDPDAIVKDNRTGFETRNPFYIELSKKVVPLIDKTLNEHGKQVQIINLTNNKKFSDAQKKLNKYLSTELKDDINGGNLKGITPPVEGIKFVRNSANVTKGKMYNLKILVNSSLISMPNKIVVETEENECIKVTPLSIELSENETNSSLIIKNIVIQAIECTDSPITIKAIIGERVAVACVNVVDYEIHYPQDGLEFYLNNLALVHNKTHKLNLFFDKNMIPFGSEIKLESMGLQLLEETIKVDGKYMLNEDIGLVEVIASGGEIGKKYTLSAQSNGIKCQANITIIEETKGEQFGGGLIAGFKLEPNDKLFSQAYYNPQNHMIMINSKNPINIRIMGDLSDKNPEYPTFNKEQTKYLCDIISTEAATLIMQDKNRKGEINYEDFAEGVQAAQALIQQHKNKIYVELFSALIKTDE